MLTTEEKQRLTEAATAEGLDPADVIAAAEEAAKLYGSKCAMCHGSEGKGNPPAYPPLAGNRAVTMDSAANLVRIVHGGGYRRSERLMADGTFRSAQMELAGRELKGFRVRYRHLRELAKIFAAIDEVFPDDVAAETKAA